MTPARLRELMSHDGLFDPALVRELIAVIISQQSQLQKADRMWEEAWFVLSGGDNPHDRCGECGNAGYGMLKDALKQYKVRE